MANVQVPLTAEGESGSIGHGEDERLPNQLFWFHCYPSGSSYVQQLLCMYIYGRQVCVLGEIWNYQLAPCCKEDMGKGEGGRWRGWLDWEIRGRQDERGV